jgi:hypothetical protein
LDIEGIVTIVNDFVDKESNKKEVWETFLLNLVQSSSLGGSECSFDFDFSQYLAAFQRYVESLRSDAKLGEASGDLSKAISEYRVYLAIVPQVHISYKTENSILKSLDLSFNINQPNIGAYNMSFSASMQINGLNSTDLANDAELLRIVGNSSSISGSIF